MTLKIELILGAILVGMCLLIGYLVHDNIWKAGYNTAMAEVAAVQAEANKQQRAKEDMDNETSDRVGDDAQIEASKTKQETASDVREVKERIKYVYRTAPAQSCTPDGSPALFPDSVLKGLSEARRAAEAASGKL